MEKQRGGLGLIIGKFLPPHAGHVHLIHSALETVDDLSVAVCSLSSEPIPGAVRVRWMREMFPQVHVVHVTDENLSFPNEHPDFWALWVDSLRRTLPPDRSVDFVFTSEHYGDELARRLGARHVRIDPERSRFPGSGTAIRNDPFSNWQYIPSLVRPWFVKRVVLLGSECTAKTTLSRELARLFDTVWVPEYSRTYVGAQNRPPLPGDVLPIARGQIAAEEVARNTANRIVIQDTDLISTSVYSRHYFGHSPPEVEREANQRIADLYLLCDINVPWEADGNQRDRGDRREEMQELFRDALRSRGIEWIDVRGTREQRLVGAAQAIEETFGLRRRN